MTDPRLGALLGAGGEHRVSLIGFPSDAGVARNGGRTGAAGGPAAIREALARLTPDAERPAESLRLLSATRDLGDAPVTGNVEVDQAALAALVGPELAADRFVIVLGGGHETSFGHFLGHASPVHILNWDAHADVRPLTEDGAHSGSPFRQAIEHEPGPCLSYTVAGLLPHSVAVEHVAYVRAHGRALFRREIETRGEVEAVYASLEGPALVSFDLDALDGCHAPGVSAPATGGLAASRWLEAAYLAGNTPSVRSADVVELCPRLDRDGQTARLAALTVWEILRGVAARPAA